MVKIKKGQEKARAFLGKGKYIYLPEATDEELEMLSKMKGYKHLFEPEKKVKTTKNKK
jgi:hypothetical protein